MTTPQTKHEWRKHEKGLYLPKAQPACVTIPSYKYITLRGEGNPNSPFFSDFIGVLYSVAYGIKMTAKKKGCAPDGHYDYTVYPLEGIWDITDEAKKNYTGVVNKDDFVFTLMIRQPDFVDPAFFHQILELVESRKPNPLLKEVTFESITDGKCIQMLHVGPYDNEPASFALMEAFALSQGRKRLSKVHREIYLSDFRKIAPEKLKTILRFTVA